MRARRTLALALGLLIVAATVAGAGGTSRALAQQGPSPKRGGVLTSLIIEAPYSWGRMQDVWLDK